MSNTKLSQTLPGLTLQTGGTAYYAPASDFQWEVMTGGGVRILRYVGSDAVVHVPPSIEGEPVLALYGGHIDGSTIIHEGAFSNMSGVREVHLPASVTDIESKTGSGSTSLGAFSECADLERVYAPNVTALGDQAFAGSGNLAYAYFPQLLTVGREVFRFCAALKHIDLPKLESATSISTFGYSGLESFNLPNLLDTVNYMFYGCVSLKRAYLPKVASLKLTVFGECHQLTDVRLGPDVALVGDSIFHVSTAPHIDIRWEGNSPGSIASSSFSTQVRHYRLSGASGWGSTLGDRPVITVDCLDPLGKANELQRVDAGRARLHPSGIQLTATDNTTLTFTYTGTDGVERSGTLTLS